MTASSNLRLVTGRALAYLEKIGPVDLTGVSTWDAENSKTDPIPPLTLEKIRMHRLAVLVRP